MIGRLGKFEDRDSSAWLQHARYFAQAALVVGEISKSEGRGYKVKTRIGKWHIQRVAIDEFGRMRIGSRFFPGAFHHGVCKIAAQDRHSVRCGVADHVYALDLEGECQVARAAAEIKNASVGASKDASEFFRCQPAPSVVHREGEEVIEEVVSRRNGAEHIAHSARGIALVASAFRTGPQTLRGR